MTWHECSFISNVWLHVDMAQSWKGTSDATRMIHQPEFSVVIGGYASSCLTSSSAVGQGHLYISTESDRSRINLEGSILRFPTICLISICLMIVSLPWDLQFLRRSPFISFYLPISNPFEGHILEQYFFQQKKNNDIAYLDMMMSFRHWTVVRSRLFLDTFDVSLSSFQEFIKRFSWMIHQHQRGLSTIHMSYSASEIAHRISRMGCQSPPGLLHS